MKYRFILDIGPGIHDLERKTVSRMSCVTTQEQLTLSLERDNADKSLVFSSIAYRYYLEFSNSYTVSFRAARSGYRSIMLRYFDRFPNESEVKEDIMNRNPVIIEANDEIYSDIQTSNILNRKIKSVDIATYENSLLPYKIFNQRGLVFTDDSNEKFTIFWGTQGMHFSRTDFLPEKLC